MTTIREGTPKDWEACVALWLAALEHREQRSQGEAVAARVRSNLNADVVRFGVVGSPPRGFAVTLAGDAGEPSVALLTNIAVAPGHAGRGVGRALLEDSARSAAAHGFSALDLEVRVGNARAESLYRGAGFLPVPGETRPHPLGGPPMVRLRLTLVVES